MFNFTKFRSSKTFVLTTICVAMFTDGFVFGIVVPVFPYILQSKALVSDDKLQISTSALTAAFAISDFLAAPFCAWYVDHFRNRHVPWYVGLLLAIAGTMLFGITDNFWTFFVSRLLQGVSSAILYTVGLAVLVENTNKDEVGRYMGTAMSCNNFGIILSPLLGGIFYEKAGKYAVFVLMVGLTGIDITLRLMMKEQNSRLETNPYHSRISNPNERPRLTPTNSSSHLITTTLSSSTKLSTGKHHTSPQIPGQARLAGIYKLIRSPRLLTALYGCFVNECIVASLCAVLPLFVHQTFHWTSLQAGCLFLAIAIPGLAGPLAGLFADKFGARRVAISGFLLTTPSLTSLLLAKTDSTRDKILLCVFLSLTGSTIIFFLSPLGADVSAVADEISVESGMDMYASAFSLMNSALAAASIIGPLVVGWIQEELGWTGTCIALGAICFSGAIPCVFFTGGNISKAPLSQEEHPENGGNEA
ncbi:hypothetical protein EG327_009353 [Venturia inaequalis]|uniref:Major facilitator superfamily (MFS) profile domain-containing protein n=1 Tax=Venturia inaequalis TaxID=5025 RepID=A0A8H3UNY7_VENIN|nr:hypothetical protein EG327_009353 [Venturia inaequalis]